MCRPFPDRANARIGKGLEQWNATVAVSWLELFATQRGASVMRVDWVVTALWKYGYLLGRTCSL